MAIGPGNLRERQLKKLEEIIDEKINVNEYADTIYINVNSLPYYNRYESDIVELYKEAGWPEIYFDNDIYDPCLVLKR